MKAGAFAAGPELQHSGTAASEWHFHQENATFRRREEGM
jgi:hypothetical protein